MRAALRGCNANTGKEGSLFSSRGTFALVTHYSPGT